MDAGPGDEIKLKIMTCDEAGPASLLERFDR
jgi:hypothetical protein